MKLTPLELVSLNSHNTIIGIFTALVCNMPENNNVPKSTAEEKLRDFKKRVKLDSFAMLNKPAEA